MRSALQQSLNVVAVRLLSIVGVEKGAEVVKRFGLPNPMKRVLPSALGATEEPLLDMTSAYSSFSNMGTRVKPHLINQVTDADGNALPGINKPETTKVISPYVASQMQDMMRGVVTGGTAASIMGNKELSKRMICGKTGTVNDFTDAWFIGYTPSYTAGVWIGYPGLKKTLGNKEAGSVAALPMWISFMEKFLADKPNDKFPKAPGPDKEIIAKRAQAESAIRKAEAAEAESAAKSTDDTADKAKSAAQDDGATAEPTAPRPAPKMDDNGETPRPSRPPREERQRDVERSPSPRPPASQPEQQTPKKRGKNG